jgi:hypothetical protein
MQKTPKKWPKKAKIHNFAGPQLSPGASDRAKVSTAILFRAFATCSQKTACILVAKKKFFFRPSPKLKVQNFGQDVKKNSADV